jgi:hypothetical protein
VLDLPEDLTINPIFNIPDLHPQFIGTNENKINEEKCNNERNE